MSEVRGPGGGYGYGWCGWRVRSEIELPELDRFDRLSGGGEADVEIQLVDAVEAPAQALRRTPFLAVGVDGSAVVTAPGIAKYAMERGTRIRIAVEAGAPQREVRLFLYGSVLGILCHQKGLFPLHAAAVAVGGRAVAFAGSGGEGKSTLAAALVMRGHKLIGDDVCVVSPLSDKALAWPSGPPVRLWSDALAALGVPEAGLTANRPGQPKWVLPEETYGVVGEPFPLSCVLVPTWALPKEPSRIEWSAGFASIRSLFDRVYRRRAAVSLVSQAELLGRAVRTARHARVGFLKRQMNFEDLATQVALVERAVEAVA